MQTCTSQVNENVSPFSSLNPFWRSWFIRLCLDQGFGGGKWNENRKGKWSNGPERLDLLTFPFPFPSSNPGSKHRPLNENIRRVTLSVLEKNFRAITLLTLNHDPVKIYTYVYIMYEQKHIHQWWPSTQYSNSQCIWTRKELIWEYSYGQYEVWHVAVTSDDLEARDGVFVADDVGDLGGPELLHPRDFVAMNRWWRRRRHFYQKLAKAILIRERVNCEKKYSQNPFPQFGGKRHVTASHR